MQRSARSTASRRLPQPTLDQPNLHRRARSPVHPQVIEERLTRLPARRCRRAVTGRRPWGNRALWPSPVDRPHLTTLDRCYPLGLVRLQAGDHHAAIADTLMASLILYRLAGVHSTMASSPALARTPSAGETTPCPNDPYALSPHTRHRQTRFPPLPSISTIRPSLDCSADTECSWVYSGYAVMRLVSGSTTIRGPDAISQPGQRDGRRRSGAEQADYGDKEKSPPPRTRCRLPVGHEWPGQRFRARKCVRVVGSSRRRRCSSISAASSAA